MGRRKALMSVLHSMSIFVGFKWFYFTWNRINPGSSVRGFSQSMTSHITHVIRFLSGYSHAAHESFLKISTRSFLILLHVLRTHYSKQFSLAKLKFRVFSKWPRKASFPLILKKLSNFIHFKAKIRREYTWNRNHALHRITYLYIKNGISFGLSKKQMIVLDSITPAYFFS